MDKQTIAEDIAVTTFRTLRHKHKWYPGAEERIKAHVRGLPFETMKQEDIFRAVRVAIDAERADHHGA